MHPSDRWHCPKNLHNLAFPVSVLFTKHQYTWNDTTGINIAFLVEEFLAN